MPKSPQKSHSTGGATAFHVVLCFFFVLIAVANLQAETISVRFNDKIISANKAEGKKQTVFDLGSPVDFSRGSVSFWVRPEWYGGERSVVPLVNLMDDNGNGLQLSKLVWQKSMAIEVLSNWKVVGRSCGEIADWIPGFSHHVAATWSQDGLILYLDGVNKIEWLLKPDSLPKLQIAKFAVGGERTSFSNLVLTDRVLSAQEINDILKKQCPVRLAVEIPDRPLRMIYPGESVKLRIQNDTGQSMKARLTYRVENFTWATPAVEKKEAIEVTLPGNSAITAKDITIPSFGLFQVSAELHSLNGQTLSQDSRVFGSGMRAPDLKTVNDSPFGWNTLSRELEKHASPIAQTGASWIRNTPDFHESEAWNDVEHEKGRFDWSNMDERVRIVRGVGLHWMFTLGRHVPQWASSSPSPDHEYAGSFVPKRMEDWSHYVFNIVNRYKDTINAWEVWNEPNGGFLVWDDKNKAYYGEYSKESVLAYFNVHKATYLAAKKADPHARIVGPCFQGFCRGYFENLIKLGLLKYTDIIAWHIYTTPDSPESCNLEKNLMEYVKIVRDAGGKQPIWNTECSYWTPPRNTTAPMTRRDITEQFSKKDPLYWRVAWPYRALDEWTAANYFVRFTLINLACGIEKVFLFDYAHRDLMWQTADPNNSPYLHTLAFNAMTRQLAGLKFLRKVPAHSDTRYIYLFSDGQRTIATVWTTDESDRIVLKVGKTHPKIRDLFGNPMKTSLENGKLTVSLSGAPQYIEGISPDIECQKDFLTVESPAIVPDDQPVTLTASVENDGDNDVAGIVLLAIPEGWSAKDAGFKFQLEPGKKARKEFAINAPCPNGIYAIKTTAEISGGGKIINTKNIHIRKPALCHPLREATASGMPLVLSNRMQVVEGLLVAGQALPDAVDAWKGPSDSSATILPAWDAERFYLTIDVVDKSICTTMSAPWMGDCIELFIDEAGTKDNIRSGVDAKCSQIFLIPEGDGKIVCDKPEKIKNAKLAMHKTDVGYRLEVSLPWVNFPAIKPQRGAVFGFDAYLDNADPNPATGKPEHKSTIAWEGMKGNFSDASRYGRIMLMGKVSFSNDFESGIWGWRQHRWAGGSNISIGLDDAEACSGKHSLKISKKGSVWGGAFINFPFENKKTYQFSCRMKLPEDVPDDEPQMDLTVRYAANPGGDRQMAKPLTPRSIKASDGWVDVKCVFTINEPEGTVIKVDGPDNGLIFPTGTTPDCTLYMDDFDLRMVETAPFADAADMTEPVNEQHAVKNQER